MFYFVVGLVVVGYLIYLGLMKIKTKQLRISCPCTFIVATSIATALYFTDHKALAWITFIFGLYLISITLIAIRKSNLQPLQTAAGTVNH
jgi:hypothetical protein